MDQADIENRFGYHAPTGNKGPKHDHVRRTLQTVAETLNSYLPEGREKSLAVTHLEEAMMWANAAIARYAEVV